MVTSVEPVEVICRQTDTASAGFGLSDLLRR